MNVAACYQLEQAVAKRGSSSVLPTLDGAIAAIVDEVEDEAPLGAAVNLAESMLDRADSDSEDSESEGEDQVAGARWLDLYADWQERDGLLN